MTFYLSVFVVTIFLILFGSLAAVQLSRWRLRRRERRSALAQPAIPPAVVPDLPVRNPAELAAVLTVEHNEGRHATAYHRGCGLCEIAAAREVFERQSRSRDAYVRGRRPAQTDLRVNAEGEIRLRVNYGTTDGTGRCSDPAHHED